MLRTHQEFREVRNFWNVCVCALMFVLRRKLRLIIILEEPKEAKLQPHRDFCILELCDFDICVMGYFNKS